jgi:hypothetical protein
LLCGAVPLRELMHRTVGQYVQLRQFFTFGFHFLRNPVLRRCLPELHRLERMEEDDLELVRRKRLETMKRNHKQKQEWLGACAELPVSV